MGSPKFYLLLTVLSALLLTSSAKAQNVLGPFDAYVSRQNPAQTRVLSGEFPFKSAKGEPGKFPASAIEGPIAVDVSINAPAVAPNQKKGAKEKPANPKSTIRVTRIPEPGTTVPAHFLLKSENFLSWLIQKTDKTFAKGLVVKFNIHSLLLKMSRTTVSVSKNSSVMVLVTKRYPVSDGSVSYQSLNNNVRLTSTSNGVRITGTNSGDDVVVATLNVGGAVYRDTIRVKTSEPETGIATAATNKEGLTPPAEEVKNPEEKSREELIQVNEANQQEIVKLKYIINWGERILFAGGLLILIALIGILTRSYLKRIKKDNQTLDEISQMQSHKVRAPVARILGLTQLFNSKDLTDPVNQEVITHITSTTADLDKVITEIIEKSDAHLKHTVAGKG
jgi:hypothetical protein